MDSRLRRVGYLGGGGGSIKVEAPSSGVIGANVSSNFNVGKEAATSLEGRVSLGMLGGIVVGIVAFYAWTRGVQGGG